LLLSALIAASNVKQTSFEPYYRKVIRNLPAETLETETTTPAEIPQKPAGNCQDCHPELGPGTPAPVRANGPAFSHPDEQPAPSLLPGALSVEEG
jgi:hypothetical protein